MFVLQARQMSALALRTFEGDMVFHIARYFPARSIMMGEPAALATVRLAIARARGHGLVMKRDVCLYLNCMVVLGSHFDEDPKFSWATDLLGHTDGVSPSERMTRVNGRMVRLAKTWRACMMSGLQDALLTLEATKERTAERPELSVNEVVQQLERIFPEGTGNFTRKELHDLAGKGLSRTGANGPVSSDERFLHISLMFLLGSGFDTDPQFPWIAEALAKPATVGSERRMHHLLADTLARVQQAVQMPIQARK